MSNIRDHHLAWRWTDPRYALFPADTLDQMQTVSEEDARALFTHAISIAGEEAFASQLFLLTTVRTLGLSTEAGCRWLRERQPELSVAVVVSWDQRTAIRTTWE